MSKETSLDNSRHGATDEMQRLKDNFKQWLKAKLTEDDERLTVTRHTKMMTELIAVTRSQQITYINVQA